MNEPCTHTDTRMLAHTYYDNGGCRKKEKAAGLSSVSRAMQGWEVLCPLSVENYWGKKKQKKKQRKVCEKEGDRWREGRKSGPQIRKREEEPGENRGAWILWCEGGLETQITNCVSSLKFPAATVCSDAWRYERTSISVLGKRTVLYQQGGNGHKAFGY